MIEAEQAYALSDLVLSGFIRVVTHPRIFREPGSLEDAFSFVEQLAGQPSCVLVQPGPRHWEIFGRSLPGSAGTVPPGAI